MTPGEAGTPEVGVTGAHARTSVGRQRSSNEDAFVMLALGSDGPSDGADPGGTEDWSEFPSEAALEGSGEAFLFLAVDGMGGAAAGEVASRLAASTVRQVVAEGWPDEGTGSADRMRELLEEAVAEANARIHGWGSQHPEYRGMGCTLTAVGVCGPEAVVGHVGDSRAYLFRDGVVRQLTEDHTVAQKLIESGSLGPEEARASGQDHVLLRAVGTEPEVEPDVEALALRPSDRLLLCTDGLPAAVSEDRITEVLTRAADAASATGELVELADAGGGPDNVTVLLVEVGASNGPETGL